MNPRLKSYTLLIMALCLQFSVAARADESDLVWSTFLGGSSSDKGNSVAVDHAGNAYVTGYTESDSFPTTAGAFDTTYDGYGDVFVAKLNLAGTALVYATFLEGSADDEGHSIVVDSVGSAYLTGETKSTDFPITAGAFDTSYNGSWRDAFVVKLSPTGGTLAYATFLGGSDVEMGYGIALDVSGNAYVTGITHSDDFPTTSGAFDSVYSSSGYTSVFVAKLDPTGQHLDYATFLEGEQDDYANDIAVDDLTNAYVIGETWSQDFPVTSGSYDTTYEGNGDVFVAKLNPAGSALNYATFLGGSWDEYGYAIALDEFASAYVTGETWSDDFPTTGGALDIVYDNVDAFVVKLNPEGNDLDYATFLGGSADDYGQGIAVDDSGKAHVTGETWSDDFPTTHGSYDTTANGNYDVFVTRLNATGSILDYGTYMGGSADDYGRGIALDSAGNAHAAGWTSSSGFPATSGVFDETHNGSADVFVAKLNLWGGILGPPEVVGNLQATLAGKDLLLTWSAVTADTNGTPMVIDLYYLYRDTVTYFLPGASPFDSTLNTFYVDTTGVVGDLGTNYYYAVTAISRGMKSGFSGVVGEFDWNLRNAHP
jgi:hypothetical protein